MNALEQRIQASNTTSAASTHLVKLFVFLFILKSNRCTMNKRARRELIVKTTLEVLQNVLPTNIMENLDKLNADDDSDDFTDNLDEEKFFYEQLVRKVPNEPEVPIVSNELSASSVSKQPKHSKRPKNVASTEPVDNNASLTYFDIVEQEMILSLPVTKANLEVCIPINCQVA